MTWEFLHDLSAYEGGDRGTMLIVSLGHTWNIGHCYSACSASFLLSVYSCLFFCVLDVNRKTKKQVKNQSSFKEKTAKLLFMGIEERPPSTFVNGLGQCFSKFKPTFAVGWDPKRQTQMFIFSYKNPTTPSFFSPAPTSLWLETI